MLQTYLHFSETGNAEERKIELKKKKTKKDRKNKKRQNRGRRFGLKFCALVITSTRQ